MNKKESLTSTTDCGVCGRALVYCTESVVRTCSLCGREDNVLIYCPEGHYVCDSCHSKDAIEVLRHVLESTTSKNPAEIIEMVMSHPSVPMHGPEHHSIVPGAIITAVKNAGYPVPQGSLEKALKRSAKVPGGWCGLYGDCGAAVGVGITVSVLTSATPLTGKERSLAIAATSFALGKMVDDQPRCCKRASTIAIRAAVEFLKDKLDISLPHPDIVKCGYSLRNRQCPHEKCPYYGS
jgi:hypothetical protein